MLPYTIAGNDALAQLIREASDKLSNMTEMTGLDVITAPLRQHVIPMCHVGRGAEMDFTENGFRLQLEWYAGQLLSMVDNEQWIGINSWINCTEKFTSRKEKN